MTSFTSKLIEDHSGPHATLEFNYNGQKGYHFGPEVEVILTQPSYIDGEARVARGSFSVEQLYNILYALDRVTNV